MCHLPAHLLVLCLRTSVLKAIKTLKKKKGPNLNEDSLEFCVLRTWLSNHQFWETQNTADRYVGWTPIVAKGLTKWLPALREIYNLELQWPL